MATTLGTTLIIILMGIPIITETTTTTLGEVITHTTILITLIITDITTPIMVVIMAIIMAVTMEDTITTTDSITTDTIPIHPIITKTEGLVTTLPMENEQHLLQERGML